MSRWGLRWSRWSGDGSCTVLVIMVVEKGFRGEGSGYRV